MSNDTKLSICAAILAMALAAIVRGLWMYSHPLGWIFGGMFAGVVTVCFAYDVLREEKRARS